MQVIPYVDFVIDMVAKLDLYNNQGKDLLQRLSKKEFFSVYGKKRKLNEGDLCW